MKQKMKEFLACAIYIVGLAVIAGFLNAFFLTLGEILNKEIIVAVGCNAVGIGIWQMIKLLDD